MSDPRRLSNGSHVPDRERALSLRCNSDSFETDNGAEFRDCLWDVGERIRSSLAQRPGDFSLATGAAGNALVYGLLGAALDHSSWIDFARSELQHALVEVANRPVNCGLFTGLAGVAFAFEKLHVLGLISAEVGQFDAIDKFIGANLPLPNSRANIDWISGLSGIGLYMQLRPASQTTSDAVAEIRCRLLTQLPETDIPPSRFSAFGERNGYRDVDIGLAHGLAGPLALFNASQQRGQLAPEIARRCAGLNRWLIDCMHGPDSDILFPSFKSGTAEYGGGRNAWCYGALGIAIALANGDDNEILSAVSGMLTRLDGVPVSRWNLNGAGLCHGTAGAIIFSKLLRKRINIEKAVDNDTSELVKNLSTEGDFLQGSSGVLLTYASMHLPEIQAHWTPLFGVLTAR